MAVFPPPFTDDATPADIEKRPWKGKWPHYIRVHGTEFIAGTMGDGVSLNELMDALQADAFASTQRNVARGEGNGNPRREYRQQASVELSERGFWCLMNDCRRNLEPTARSLNLHFGNLTGQIRQ